MFDPYHKWLAIPKGQRPPTFYQLLGIAGDETDREVIEEAAIRQTTHLRTYQTGPHAKECTALLNEVAQARATLLNPAKRTEYDARLKVAGPATHSGPPNSVNEFCDLLIRSHLLGAEEVQQLRQRWGKESKEHAGPEDFARWLTAHEWLTDYQAAMVRQGHANGFFLDAYKILDRLGRGRHSLVFKAVHRLGRIVALKALPAALTADGDLLARFRWEAELAGRLEHPNLVRLLHVGETYGIHFLVLEYVEGKTLQDILDRRGRLDMVEAVYLVREALLGLQHLHERGLVHGHLEPANLMVASAPGKPMPYSLKILEPSLGRALGAAALKAAPEYLPPEPVLDVRSDIFSLGCILYRALTGQGATPPRPLSEFLPQAPADLVRIVRTMLGGYPEQRYPTAALAARDLHELLKTLVPDLDNEPYQPPGDLSTKAGNPLGSLLQDEGPERDKPSLTFAAAPEASTGVTDPWAPMVAMSAGPGGVGDWIAKRKLRRQFLLGGLLGAMGMTLLAGLVWLLAAMFR